MKHNLFAAISLLLTLNVGQINASEVSVDHIVLTTNNLNQSVSEFKQRGFLVKKGKHHLSGLHNAFIEFSNSSEIELMAITGRAKGEIAETYLSLLNEHGNAAVYLALKHDNLNTLSNLLNQHDIKNKLIQTKLWKYLTFERGSGLEHVFFIEHNQLLSGERTVSHKNGVSRIEQVTIEGNNKVLKLFNLLGAKLCQGQFNVFKFNNMTVKIVKPPPSRSRLFISAIAITGGNSQVRSFISHRVVFTNDFTSCSY